MQKKIMLIFSIVLIGGIFLSFYMFKLRTFTVIFDSKGGTWIAAQEVRINHQVTKPKDPILQDYGFKGWYYLDQEYDFTTPVTKNMTLIAKWKEKATKE